MTFTSILNRSVSTFCEINYSNILLLTYPTHFISALSFWLYPAIYNVMLYAYFVSLLLSWRSYSKISKTLFTSREHTDIQCCQATVITLFVKLNCSGFVLVWFGYSFCLATVLITLSFLKPSGVWNGLWTSARIFKLQLSKSTI